MSKDSETVKIIKEIINTIDCRLSITSNNELVIEIGRTIRVIKLSRDECNILKETLL